MTKILRELLVIILVKMYDCNIFL